MTNPVWRRRRTRVDTLAGTRDHARELLLAYDRVLVQQEVVSRETALARGFRLDPTHPPRGHWLRAVDRHQRRVTQAFRRFVQAVAPGTTDVLIGVASLLHGQDLTDRLLTAFLGGEPLEALATEVACETLSLEFFPRAFLQPVSEALVAGGPSQPPPTPVGSSGPSFMCPRCGSLPQVVVFRDEMEVRGRRLLVCSLCATEWGFPRATCPACGESDSPKLQHHHADPWPHVRVEECRTCRNYIKSVDLRADGAAVPVIDELASVELDLWAAEQGLVKLQRNLLGL